MVIKNLMEKIKVNQFSSIPANLIRKSAFWGDFSANTDLKLSKCSLLDGKHFLKADFSQIVKLDAKTLPLRCFHVPFIAIHVLNWVIFGLKENAVSVIASYTMLLSRKKWRVVIRKLLFQLNSSKFSQPNFIGMVSFSFQGLPFYCHKVLFH